MLNLKELTDYNPVLIRTFIEFGFKVKKINTEKKAKAIEFYKFAGMDPINPEIIVELLPKEKEGSAVVVFEGNNDPDKDGAILWDEVVVDGKEHLFQKNFAEAVILPQMDAQCQKLGFYLENTISEWRDPFREETAEPPTVRIYVHPWYGNIRLWWNGLDNLISFHRRDKNCYLSLDEAYMYETIKDISEYLDKQATPINPLSSFFGGTPTVIARGSLVGGPGPGSETPPSGEPRH